MTLQNNDFVAYLKKHLKYSSSDDIIFIYLHIRNSFLCSQTQIHPLQDPFYSSRLRLCIEEIQLCNQGPEKSIFNSCDCQQILCLECEGLLALWSRRLSREEVRGSGAASPYVSLSHMFSLQFKL